MITRSLPKVVRAAMMLGALLLPAAAHAANYYVAPDGSDGAAGSEAAPFATVGRGQQAASTGDTVFIRGGVYRFSGTTATVGVSFNKSGAANNPIRYFAYAGETPIFDFFDLTPQARVTGFNVQCSWVHLRGIELRGVQQEIEGDSWGLRIQGSNNVIESLNVHHNEAPGIFITSGANNLVLNCDSHDNYDPLEGGGNGDGFGCHSTGGGNVIRGCRGFRNSDDGYDFINASGSCTVEGSWAWSNGYRPGTMTAAGNGAGFKAGGYGSPPEVPSGGAASHVVRQCLAFRNRSQGFYANHHPGRITFDNNTAFNNPVNFNMLADSGFPSDHVIRNNLSAGTGTAINNLTGGTATFNAWNLSVSVSAADFASMMEAEAEGPRQADGSLPNIALMHLVSGSDLVDKGTNVGLPFGGAAPDLGAFEFGGAGGAGTGGAGGTGGAPGRGGTGGAGRGGTGGTAGTAGGAGRGGATGGAGTAGRGGQSGAIGTAGTTGAAGATGSAGTGGDDAGTSGTAGSASAGTIGSAGGGGAGTGGTSAATGAAGTSGLEEGSGGCACATAPGDADLGSLSLWGALAWLAMRGRRGARRRSA